MLETFLCLQCLHCIFGRVLSLILTLAHDISHWLLDHFMTSYKQVGMAALMVILFFIAVIISYIQHFEYFSCHCVQRALT